MTPSPLPTQALLIHADFVRRVANALVGGHGADDLCQDTWVAALTRPPRDASSLRGWLGTVVRNSFRNRRRLDTLRAEREQRVSPGGAVPAVDEIVAREELRRRVVTAVLELPAALRDVVLLRYYEDLDSLAIGKRLGRPAGTVRWQLRGALQQLRGRLDRDHGERAAWAGPLAGWRRAGLPGFGVLLRIALPVRIAAAALFVLAAAWLFAPGWLSLPALLPSQPGPGMPVVEVARTDGREERTRGETPVARRELVVAPVSAAALPRAPLRGIVRAAATHEPVGAADVAAASLAAWSDRVATIDEHGVRRQARSAEDGTFEIADLPAGPYELRARGASGRLARQLVGHGAERAGAEVTLWLEDPDPYRGLIVVKVLDASQYAVVGADVTVAAVCTHRGPIGWNGSPAITGTTGSDGVFRFADPERLELAVEGMAMARTPDGRVGMTTIPRPEHRGYEPWVVVVVDRTAVLTGRIEGMGGRDWSGTVVRVFRGFVYGNVVPELDWAAFEARPDAAGNFRCEGLPAGWYQIDVESPGAVRVLPVSGDRVEKPTMVQVLAGAVAEVRLEVAAAATLRGRVVDSAGTAIPGAEVTTRLACLNAHECSILDRECFLDCETWASVWRQMSSPFVRQSVQTDAEGCYALTRLQPGKHDVFVTCAGMSTEVQARLPIASGEVRELQHRLLPAGTIRGVASAERCVGVREAREGALVRCLGNSMAGFALPGLAPGRYEVGYLLDLTFRALTTVEVTAGCARWVDLRATPLGTLRGMLFANGTPMAGAEVRREGRVATVAADGSFALELDIPLHEQGDAARVSHRGLELRWRHALPMGLSGDVQLGVIEVGARRIEIQVVDEKGMPVGAMLQCYGGSNSATLRVPDGVLREQWVAPGQLDIEARCADGTRLEHRIIVPPDRDPPACVLRKQATGSVHVRVLDADGAAAVGAHVDAFEWAKSGPEPTDGAAFAAQRDRSLPDIYCCSADAAGCVTLRGLRPGPVLVYYAGRSQLTFAYEGSMRRGPPPVEQIVEVRAGETTELLFTLPR